MKIFFICVLMFCGVSYADQMQCPMHDQHLAGVNERGDHAMGFDHTKTTHNFLLSDDGGVIRVVSNDATDHDSRDAIRMHMQHIASMFADGNFEIPMFIHDRVPPGVDVMKQQKDKIKYQYHELENGAEVAIQTEDAEALAAVHDFLRFQIEDHQTGDPLK
jgi:hypothetical protein